MLLTTATAKLTPLGFMRFAVHGFGPFLLQCCETTARLVAKTIQHLKQLLCFLKSSVLAIKLLLFELLDTFQHLLKRLLGVNENRPLAVAEDKVVRRLMPVGLALTGTQPPKERFQLIVGAVPLWPGITGEEPGPAVRKGRADMGDHGGILRMVRGMLVQFRQKRFDPLLHLLAAGARRALDCWRIQPSLQLHQPAALAFELPIGGGEGHATLHHG